MNVIQPFVVQIKWIKSYLSILFTREFAWIIWKETRT